MATSDEFVSRMFGSLTDAGLPRMPARVFSALLVDDNGQMTTAQLLALFGASAGSVSEAVRYVENLAMIRRQRTVGQPYDTYVVDAHAWYDATLRVGVHVCPMLAALDT